MQTDVWTKEIQTYVLTEEQLWQFEAYFTPSTQQSMM